jgi:hypothetical protein
MPAAIHHIAAFSARLALLLAGVVMAAAPAWATDTPPPYTLQHYQGTVDGRLPFQMVLHPQGPGGQPCEGSYVYRGQRLPIPLLGLCSAERLRLQELPARNAHAPAGPAHRIEAQLQQGVWQGQWLSGDGRSVLRFDARPVPPDRRALLQQVVGEHPLEAISGFFGANTMSDITRDGSRWQASSSSISGGTRQGQPVGLRRSDLAVLNGLRLRVAPTLDIELLAQGRVVARFPFGDSPAFNVTHISREDGAIQGIFHGEHSHWVGQRLRIATTDEIKLLPLLPFQNIYLDAAAPTAVVLELDPLSLSFELRLVSGHCCDQVTLQFVAGR